MGHRNLDLYYRQWADHPDLGHVSQRMLAYICYRCSDDAQPPVYYEGLEALIVASGMTKGSASIATMRRNAQRALKQIKDAGAIVSSGQAGPGVRENYALTLDPTVSAVPEGRGRAIKWRLVEKAADANGRSELPPNGRSELPPNGRSELPPNGRSELPGVDVHCDPSWTVEENVPKEYLTNSKESSIESGISNSSKVTTLRGGGLENDEDEELPVTLEEQRNRMMAAFREAHPEEFQPTGTDDGIW